LKRIRFDFRKIKSDGHPRELIPQNQTHEIKTTANSKLGNQKKTLWSANTSLCQISLNLTKTLKNKGFFDVFMMLGEKKSLSSEASGVQSVSDGPVLTNNIEL